MNSQSNKHARLGRRLRDIRTHLGETQTAFAERFGLKRHDIANYERGRADLPSRLVGSLDKLGFNISWLLTGTGGMLRGGIPTPNSSDLVLVSRYDVRVGAGHGTFVIGEDVVGSVAFKRDWIKERGLNSNNLALVDVVGDSMEKVLREDDVVLIDLSQAEIVSGKAYVIRIGDELLVKYLQYLPGGLIQVFSENSAVYPPFTVAKKDLGTEIFVIGRVVASAHMW
ncbi:MAG: XRE family transcriptional regulator [Candidatus Neomarinimicrobiota bacterium]